MELTDIVFATFVSVFPFCCIVFNVLRLYGLRHFTLCLEFAAE